MLIAHTRADEITLRDDYAGVSLATGSTDRFVAIFWVTHSQG